MPENGQVEIRNGIPWVYRKPPGHWVVKRVTDPLDSPPFEPFASAEPDPLDEADDD